MALIFIECPFYHHSGTKDERGLHAWDKVNFEDSGNTFASEEVYDLPFGMTSCLQSKSWVRYIPFCPQRGDTQPNSEGNDMSQSWGAEHSTRV